MRKYLIFIKAAIILCLFIFSIIVINYFINSSILYEWNESKLSIVWMVTIIYFTVTFYLLLYLVSFKIFNIFFISMIASGTPSWIFLYFLELFKIEPNFLDCSIIRDLIVILCISILSPGLTLNFIKFIKNNSNHSKKRRFLQKYRIHEGFVGILFVIFAFFLWVIRLLLIQHEVMKNQLRIYLAVDTILLLLFLFSGSFLVFRDLRDVLQFKFIEKREVKENSMGTTVFDQMTPDSIKFFSSPRVSIYHIGILLNSFAVSMIIHGTDFLSMVIFNLNHEEIVLIGCILCFCGGGMIGKDWYRIFAKLYPELYQEVEEMLDELRK